jgi:hypothetical protein
VICKASYFVQAMSYSASISILTVISVERYVAIIYPMHSRRMQTMFLLRATVIGVWAVSAASGIPYLMMYDIQTVPHSPTGDISALMFHMLNRTRDGTDLIPLTGIEYMHFCLPKNASNTIAHNLSTFVLWYAVPLLLMAFVYSRISVVLWRSSNAGGGAIGYNACPRMAIHAVAGSLASSIVATQQPEHEQLTPPMQSTDFSCNSSPIGGLWPKRKSGPADVASTSTCEVQRTTTNNREYFTTDKAKPASPDSLLTDVDEPQPLVFIYTKRISQETTERHFRLKKQRQSLQQGNKSGARETRDDNRGRRKWLIGSTHSRHGQSVSAAATLSASTVADSHGDAAFGARRKVIRLLIALVVSFAVCVLPYHVRILWLTFSKPFLKTWQTLIPPFTFIMYYLNSALNPILYAFLSNKFRSSLVDLFLPVPATRRMVSMVHRPRKLAEVAAGAMKSSRLRVSFNLVNTVAT